MAAGGWQLAWLKETMMQWLKILLLTIAHQTKQHIFVFHCNFQLWHFI